MRRTAVVVASLLASAALQPVSAGQAVAPVERAARISLSAPATVAPNSTVTLTGRTRARRGAKVKIYQRPMDRSSWNLEGTTRVKKRGKFRYSEGVTDFSRYYRACVRRSCSSARLVTVAPPTPPPTPPPTTPQPTSLALTAGPAAQIEAGQSVTVSGTASANLAGTAVYLQAYDGVSQTWGAIGGAVVSGSATWTVSGPIGTAGRAIGLRVISADTPSLIGSSVAAGVVTVFGWTYLSDLSTVEGEWDDADAYRISGTTYVNSVVEDSEYIQVDLARSCIKFDAVVGISDSSTSGSRASLRLLADSVQRYSNTNLTLGVGFPVSFDLTNALRLVIQPTSVSGSPYVVLGDAKVLCAF